MPRESRSYSRRSGLRDPSLIVIATEGEVTEQWYFSGVQEKCLDARSRIKLEVLPPRDEGKSAAKYVIGQLDLYKKEYGLNDRDELCVVIDRDRQSFKEDEAALIARICAQKGYFLALSNPAFELWLLLHHVDVQSCDEQERDTIFANKQKHLKKKLRETLNQLSLTHDHVESYWPFTNTAISRAELMDTNPEERWPNMLGSRVYVILKKILATITVVD